MARHVWSRFASSAGKYSLANTILVTLTQPCFHSLEENKQNSKEWKGNIQGVAYIYWEIYGNCYCCIIATVREAKILCLLGCELELLP